MKILAIRGQNLASLGQPFVLDFEAEPLAGTGLFAITGDTGSGKSTILDALCLALYGKYPRFAEQQTDSSPDPGGTVRILDGSAILRRGAGHGYAEADFLGRDGRRYRARWEARRSRNKADGAVQDARRLLYEIQPESLLTVATSKTEVRDAVQDKTGLTFEQFCRTVLLAQGQFDSFLLADKHERGELLEKLTETAIYGRISQRVRGNTRALEQEVGELERRRATMGLLAPFERDALLAEVGGLHEELANKGAAAEDTQQKLNRIDALAAARVRFTHAEDAVAQARRKQDEAATVRQQSAEFTSAEQFRALWIEEAETRNAVPVALEANRLAEAALAAATAKAVAAADLLAEAQAQSDHAEHVFTVSGPLWNEAAQLDAEIAIASTEWNNATETAGAKQLSEEGIAADLAALETDVASVAVDLDAAERQLAACVHQLPLVTRQPEFEQLVTQHKSVWKEKLATAEVAKQAKSHEERLLADAVQKEEGLAANKRLLAQQTDEVAALRDEYAICNQPSLEAQVEQVTMLDGALRDALRDAGLYTAQTAKLAEITHTLSNFEEVTALAAGREMEVTAQVAALSARLAELSPLADLAEDSVDARTVALRSRMITGEKCPVCGSEDHPYLQHGTDDALTALAATMRERRATLQAELDDSQRAARNAAREVAEARNRTKLTGDRQQETRAAIAVLEADYDGSLSSLGALTKKVLQSAPPAVLDDAAEGALQALKEASLALGSTARAALQHARLLRGELDRKDGERAATQRRLLTEEQPLHTAKEDARLAALTASEAERNASVAALRADYLEEQLAPALALSGTSMAKLRSDNGGALRDLQRTINIAAAAQATEVTLRERAATLARGLESKKILHTEAVRQSRGANQIAQGRKQELAKLAQARGLLLGGESTATHRTRVNDARLAAQQQRDLAQHEDGRLKQQATAAGVEADHAQKSLAHAQAALHDAAEAFTNGCAMAGRSPERVSELLAQPAATVAALRAQVHAVDAAVGDAQTVLDTCRRYVDEVSADSPAETERSALETILRELREAEAALNQTLGQRGQVLRHDTQQREGAVALETEIEGKQAELTEWQQVDTAIGSTDGHRFRQFAQSLTLEELVLLANEHLDSFSNRYKLLRSPGTELALHIVDKDMGDGERPTRSLSGGERFLVSLSLALALAGLEGRDFMVDTLFIDEGFGSLDGDTLAIATTALETLQSRGRKVGIVTHVEAMKENIATQVRVEKLGGGSSVVVLGSRATAAG